MSVTSVQVLHKALVIRFVKLVQKKSVDMGTDRLGMRIAIECMHDHTHARTQFLR